MVLSAEKQAKGIYPVLNELLQLRREASRLDLLSARRVITESQQPYLSTLSGRGMEFDEVRGYLPGDDIRTIDWRVTARTGKPHTKLFREEKERPVFIVVDQGSSMFFGTRTCFKSVMAAQIAALFGWATINQGDRLGAIYFSNNSLVELSPKPHQRTLLPLFHLLCEVRDARYQMTPPDAFAKALHALRRVIKPGSLIILISDFSTFNREAERHIRSLVQYNDMIACHITDPLEQILPAADRYLVSNGQATMVIDTSDSHYREQYQRDFVTGWQRLEKTMQQCRIPLIQIATNENGIQKIVSIFKKAK